MAKKQYFENESGNLSLTIILILLLIVGVFLAYLLFNQPKDKKAPQVAEQILPAQEFVKSYSIFSDGLGKPDSKTEYTLNEFGEGTASIEIFNRDLNSDGVIDRISRIKQETGNAHSYYEYKIELRDKGYWRDITPDDFRTVEGADCSLQKLQFLFTPVFKVKKIYRNFETSWDTPSVASGTIYQLQNNSLVSTGKISLSTVCDVKELF